MRGDDGTGQDVLLPELWSAVIHQCPVLEELVGRAGN